MPQNINIATSEQGVDLSLKDLEELQTYYMQYSNNGDEYDYALYSGESFTIATIIAELIDRRLAE